MRALHIQWQLQYTRQSLPARAGRRVGCSGPRHRQLQGLLFIWLVLTPQAGGVQVWQQGHIHGRPLFNTGGASDTNNVYDLQPVRHPNAPVVDSSALCRPAPLRDIAVYTPDCPSCPQVLTADDRLHDSLLFTWICRALGLQASEWRCRRLIEALPAFPAEQYVLSPASLPWNHVLLPIDLRPLGGALRLYEVPRCQPCGFLASIALVDQGYGRPDEEILCRTSQGWFLSEAYVTLLPHGDAFQIWYRHQADVVPPGPDLGSPRAAASLEDRFAASLEPTPGSELVFHEGSLHNAVIIGQHGLVYVDVPRFADQVTVRSAALQHALQPGAPYRQITHFAMVLPPLEELPAIQFAAVTCSGTEAPAIVDLRPLGGSLAACPVADRSLPFHRALIAVNHFGEPDPEHPVQHRLQQGRLVVMHNEVPIDPFSPVTGAHPLPLVVTHRRTSLATGFQAKATSTSSASSGFRATPAICSLLLLGSIGSGSRAAWMRGGLLLTAIWRAVPTQEDVPGWTVTDGALAHWDRCPQRASVLDHNRLSLQLDAAHSEAALDDHLPYPAIRQGSSFTFEARSPCLARLNSPNCVIA